MPARAMSEDKLQVEGVCVPSRIVQCTVHNTGQIAYGSPHLSWRAIGWVWERAMVR